METNIGEAATGLYRNREYAKALPYFIWLDGEGRLAVSKYFEVWPDSMPVYTVNEYGEDGLLLESRTEDENRDLLHCERYTYNSFGKISEYTSYDANGKALYSYRYYFDEEGNRTRSERYDGEGNLVSTGR